MIELQQYRLNAVGAPASTLASLIGLSSGSISKYFSGSTSFSPQVSRRIDEALADLETLKSLTAPIPVDWSAVGIVRQCLDNIKDRRLEIRVTVRDPEPKPRAFAVQFRSNGYFFWRRNRNGELGTVMNLLQAQVMTEEVADELVKRLTDLGHRCVKVRSQFADIDTISIDLESVWPEPKPVEGKSNVRRNS